MESLIMDVLKVLIKIISILANITWKPVGAYVVTPVILAYKVSPQTTVPAIVGWLTAAWLVTPDLTHSENLFDRIFTSMRGGFQLMLVHLVFLVIILNIIAEQRFIMAWYLGAAFWMFLIYSVVYPLFKLALKWALILSLIVAALLLYRFIQANSGPIDIGVFMK